MAATSRTLDGERGQQMLRTLCVKLSAAVVVGWVAYNVPGLVVPPLLAIVLAIALSPIARRLERLGMPPTASSLLCTGFVGAVVASVASLVAYQAGAMLRQLLGQLDEISELLARTLKHAGVETAAATPAFWRETLAGAIRGSAGWIPAGFGGAIGFVSGAVVVLIALFFLLRRRAYWSDRFLVVAARLGLRSDPPIVHSIRNQLAVYLGFLSVIAASYTVLISVLFWGLGLPNPLLWGVLTGMLEFIPIFGPLISGSLATVGSLAAGSLWKTALVAGVYITLHTIEGYVIWPIVFKKTIRFDEVSILVGILFFGWLLGPIGPVLGLPLIILIRGLAALTPATPALDALVDADDAVDDRERSGSD